MYHLHVGTHVLVRSINCLKHSGGYDFPVSSLSKATHISRIMLCAHSCQCYCNSKYNTKPPIIPTFLKKCTNSLSNSVGKIAMERSAKAGNLTFFGTALVQRPTFMTNVQWQVSTVGPKQKTKNVSTRTKPTATRGSQQHKRVATREEGKSVPRLSQTMAW
jgi:hypothetical protein